MRSILKRRVVGEKVQMASSSRSGQRFSIMSQKASGRSSGTGRSSEVLGRPCRAIREKLVRFLNWKRLLSGRRFLLPTFVEMLFKVGHL